MKCLHTIICLEIISIVLSNWEGWRKKLAKGTGLDNIMVEMDSLRWTIWSEAITTHVSYWPPQLVAQITEK